jgi:hypothetical protein
MKIEIYWESLPGAYCAYLPDEYDGAPDAGPQPTGWGKTKHEALRDLADQLEDRDDTKLGD